ncbi:MAG TPA: DUF2892 domain-containing protein, partial [Thermoanaerobaculia bacterium]|nr:DUF2892 domain-containing protein [Thermoanaerobaculia bacterium]
TQEGLRTRWNTGREKFGAKLGRLGHDVSDKLGTVVNREKLGSVNVGKAERWASVLGGAALAALALRSRNRKAGLGVAALTGLPLLWRGATGHCPVYEKMGIDRTNGAGTGTSLASDHTSTDSPALLRPTTPGLDESVNPSQL